MKRFFRPQIVILLLILTTATFLNFYHLKKRDLVFFTEAEYLLEASFILHLPANLSFFKSIMDRDRSGPPEGMLFGKPLDAAKPLHTLFVALLSLIIGLKDYTGLYLSAIFGVGIICLSYIITRKFYGEKTALLSAFILAVMPYQVMYSRSGLPEIDSSFLFYMAIFLYLLSLKSNLKDGFIFSSGLFIGLSLTTNHRWVIFVPFIFFFEVYLSKGNLRAFFKRAFLLFGSMVIPVLICEIPYTLARFYSPLPEGIMSYLGQVIEDFNSVRGGKKDIFEGLYLYSYFLYKLVGPASLLFLAIGIWSSKGRFSKETLILLGIIFAPIFIYTFFSVSRAPRNLSISLPAISIIMARGVLYLCERSSQLLKALATGLILFALIWSGFELNRILGLSSGHKEALQYMLKEGNPRHFSTCRMVASIYMDQSFVLWPPTDMETMKKLYQDYGFRFLWVDWKRYAWEWWFGDVIKIVESKIKPCYVIANNPGTYWAHLYENEYATYRSNAYVREVLKDKDLGKIKLYDLEELF